MKHKVFTASLDNAALTTLICRTDSGIHKEGWQTIVTAYGPSAGQSVTVTVWAAHVIDGIKRWFAVHTEDITTAAQSIPNDDGPPITSAAFAHLMVQDPWAKYDDLQVSVEGTGTWTIGISVRCPDLSL